MRSLELSGVICEGCRKSQPRDRWGLRCDACHGGSFHVELERGSEGFDLSGLGAIGGAGGADVGFALSVLDDDVEGPGLYFRTHAWLECGLISTAEIAAFLKEPLDERIRSYISWKRRELEGSLPEGRRICGRCRVAFTVYDNAWNRDGLCSKACHRVFLKSRAKPG